jgi:hypothetical protein
MMSHFPDNHFWETHFSERIDTFLRAKSLHNICCINAYRDEIKPNVQNSITSSLNYLTLLFIYYLRDPYENIPTAFCLIYMSAGGH